MNINPETEKKIEELQLLEHNIQQFLMQKQTFQVELNECLNAIEEVKRSDGEIYKVIGEVMIKSEKEKTLKDLEEKKRVLEIRVSSIEKQEKLLENKANNIRKEINEFVGKNSGK